MLTGATPVTQVEDLLQRVHIRVAVTRRVMLDESWWWLDLLSPFWRIYVNNRSGAYIEHEGKRVDLEVGRIYVVPAWVQFRTGLDRLVAQDYVHFYLNGVSPALQRRLFRSPISIKPQGALASLQRVWQQGIAKPDADFGLPEFCWGRSFVEAVMASVWSGLTQADRHGCFRALTESTAMQPALDCIESRLADPPSNRELAALCNTSEDHFIRQFRATMGTTPAQYGLERRVDVAAEWLTDTRRSIKDIADATGFVDRFHFSRVIKTRLGLPPGEYRRLHWKQGADFQKE